MIKQFCNWIEVMVPPQPECLQYHLIVLLQMVKYMLYEFHLIEKKRTPMR